MLVCPHCHLVDSAKYAFGSQPYAGLYRYCMRCGGFSVYAYSSKKTEHEFVLCKLTLTEVERIRHTHEALLLRLMRGKYGEDREAGKDTGSRANPGKQGKRR